MGTSAQTPLSLTLTLALALSLSLSLALSLASPQLSQRGAAGGG